MSQNNIIVLFSILFVFHKMVLCINANSDETNINVNCSNQIALNISQDINQTHGCGCMDEFTRMINVHWSKNPQNTKTNYIVTIIFTVMMLVGYCGNLLIIDLYDKCKSLQTSANLLVMNLAVSDFFMLAKTFILICNSYYQCPVLGNMGCQIYGFVGNLVGTVSNMTIASISFDRYYVIMYPLKIVTKTSKKRAKMIIGMTWAYGLILSLLPLLNLGYSQYVPDGFLTSCNIDYLSNKLRVKVIAMVFFIAQYCFPISIIICYYALILKIVLTKNIATNSRYGQEEARRKTALKLATMIFKIFILCLLSWVPNSTMTLLGILNYKEFLTPFGSMFSAIMQMALVLINPWVYGVTHPQYKVELAKLWRRKKKPKIQLNIELNQACYPRNENVEKKNVMTTVYTER